MEVFVKAVSWYACELDDNQTRQVVEYMAMHSCSAEYAVEMLYSHGNFGLYDKCIESDFETDTIENVSLNDDDIELLAEYGLE